MAPVAGRNADSLFGIRLKLELDKRGMTQSDLAAATGITAAAISRYMTGARSPKIENLTVIAGALGIPVAALLGGEQSEPDELDEAVRIVCARAPDLTRAHRKALARAFSELFISEGPEG